MSNDDGDDDSLPADDARYSNEFVGWKGPLWALCWALESSEMDG